MYHSHQEVRDDLGRNLDHFRRDCRHLEAFRRAIKEVEHMAGPHEQAELKELDNTLAVCMEQLTQLCQKLDRLHTDLLILDEIEHVEEIYGPPSWFGL